LFDVVRIYVTNQQKLDLYAAIIGTIVQLWVIVALLVLIESIRREQAIPAALFYVVTMATFLMLAPALPSVAPMTRMLEGTMMLANIIVHICFLVKLPRSET